MATWYTPRCTKKFWHPSSWVYKNYPVSELAGGGLLPEGPRAGVGHLLVRFVADLALQDRQVVPVASAQAEPLAPLQGELSARKFGSLPAELLGNPAAACRSFAAVCQKI